MTHHPLPPLLLPLLPPRAPPPQADIPPRRKWAAGSSSAQRLHGGTLRNTCSQVPRIGQRHGGTASEEGPGAERISICQRSRVLAARATALTLALARGLGVPPPVVLARRGWQALQQLGVLRLQRRDALHLCDGSEGRNNQ